MYVYADFDWLKEVELVGELGYESLRGSDSYSFKFADSWIKKYNAILSAKTLTTILGYNIPSRIKISSVVLPMHCPTDGGALSFSVVNKYWHKRKTDLYADYHRLTF